MKKVEFFVMNFEIFIKIFWIFLDSVWDKGLGRLGIVIERNSEIK